MIERILDILRHRDLLRALVVRDFKARYKSASLGFLWFLVTPLAAMAIYTVVFSFVLRVGVENFPLFFICGYLPWQFLASSLSISLVSILSNADLVKKAYFPREVLPIAVVITNFINLLLSVPLLLIFLYAFKVPLGRTLSLLPIILVLQFIFVTGLSLMVSSLQVFYRDLLHIVEILLPLWFFMTPIVYPISMVPDKFHLRDVLLANPMVPMITVYRNILFEAKFPQPGYLAGITLAALVSIVLGFYVFSKHEAAFAEEL